MKVSLLVTDDWFFWSHRLGLARRLRDAGCRVLVITSNGDYRRRIEAEGFEFAAVHFDRTVVGQLRNLPLVQRLRQIYRSFQPDVAHHISFLPITLGTAAARAAGVPKVVNALTGLGVAFGDEGVAWPLRKAVELGYRSALVGSRIEALFQNDEDRRLMLELGLAHPDRAHVIRGSGVDLQRFEHRPEPAGPCRVLFSGRMLVSKGVHVLVEAAERLRERAVPHQLVLLGEPHPDNPDAIPREQLQDWHQRGLVDWLGRRSDMPEVLAGGHIVCLPSWYREGVPMALLEGAACGRALVTTDRPGCRDIARHDVTGLCVPARDPNALADALQRLIEDDATRMAMGQAARDLAEREFSLDVVAERTLELYRGKLALAA